MMIPQAPQPAEFYQKEAARQFRIARLCANPAARIKFLANAAECYLRARTIMGVEA